MFITGWTDGLLESGDKDDSSLACIPSSSYTAQGQPVDAHGAQDGTEDPGGAPEDLDTAQDEPVDADRAQDGPEGAGGAQNRLNSSPFSGHRKQLDSLLDPQGNHDKLIINTVRIQFVEKQQPCVMRTKQKTPLFSS